ncbi:bifunctional precorrin-2 dehydrogenase/sirohydrochlorin ferrochelatase [Aerococcus urinae]|uniref:precorrin-2 dehydrogenase n=1 Tax=Aerococcus urinae TaxID=1376 RepID=A0A0X8FEV9_9LACT|nr:bifunctional precorrin-2 dehydrogenase/sirohydrochlorin ferrochelatase [Aerococcus urinae]AMB95242.1 hypothetical protein AWM73_01355 [Aerococcus urinae]MCY3031963.1 bifunctional precorrin-2 dehydrogenase/sirohydrochlorin ferrochelatase [Aerococcus urinae]MCY3037043.1 bifunctional precorrin-2 dehydrogenase/sirohydrochlorin ferrochelatase [Aerococcus urinae]MCY3044010.1 bifunctional precorrin-2 dehydrogenase/sirohydrochlorin ferrochelatase [Aerococcus urinae]MCY3046723.1 bifunctional precorr
MYPVMLDISHWSVLIIGGGRIAERKLQSLLKEAGQVTVLAPQVTEQIAKWAREGHLLWLKQSYQGPLDLHGYQMIFACTDHSEVNQAIAEDLESGQLINQTGDKRASNFFNMKTINHEGYVIAISSQGQSPAGAKGLGESIASYLKDKENRI